MKIFNPEHDLCLANADPNFIPPASALKFGEDCAKVMDYLTDEKHGDNSSENEIIVWGWNPCLKNKLLKQGYAPENLPDDKYLAQIRDLSHRRYAIKAREYIIEKISDEYRQYITPVSPMEISSTNQIDILLSRHDRMVFKSPWSGSGKGLRWADYGENDRSFAGWSKKIIKSQGSLIAEVRNVVVQDFAMLFCISDTVIFEGYSMFDCSNGAYRGNILCSDSYIIDTIGRFIPSVLLDYVQKSLIMFLQEHFLGQYNGYIGVDMYICDDGGKYLLQPCVEINVRMTMGLLAHRIYEKLYSEYDYAHFRMNVVFSPEYRTLMETLRNADILLTDVSETSKYAVAVFPL